MKSPPSPRRSIHCVAVQQEALQTMQYPDYRFVVHAVITDTKAHKW